MAVMQKDISTSPATSAVAVDWDLHGLGCCVCISITGLLHSVIVNIIIQG